VAAHGNTPAFQTKREAMNQSPGRPKGGHFANVRNPPKTFLVTSPRISRNQSGQDPMQGASQIGQTGPLRPCLLPLTRELTRDPVRSQNYSSKARCPPWRRGPGVDGRGHWETRFPPTQGGNGGRGPRMEAPATQGGSGPRAAGPKSPLPGTGGPAPPGPPRRPPHLSDERMD